MAKFVEVTDVDLEKKVYVNLDLVTIMKEHVSDNNKRYTTILFVDGSYVYVSETVNYLRAWS